MTDTHAHVEQARSEQGQVAILRAAGELLAEVGYGALTMSGIAERAEVDQQTVYRWWSTKAEVLLAAAIADAARTLLPEPQPTVLDDLAAYIEAVVRFLAGSPAGTGYRALIAEAQHDIAVAQLMAAVDIFGDAARTVLSRMIARGDLPATIPLGEATAVITGPAYYQVLECRQVGQLNARALAMAALAAARQLPAPDV